MCTHPWPRLRARCALGRPCRGAPGAVLWPSLGRIAACARPCRGHVAGVSLRARALCHDTRPCCMPLPVTIQNLYRDPRPCRACSARHVTRAATRVVAPNAVSWRITASYRCPGALYHDPKSPSSATIQFFCIATQGPPSARYKLGIATSSPGHVAHALRVVSQASSVVSCARPAVSRPLLACPGLCTCCVPTQPAVCHNTAYCIVTQF